MTEPDIDQWCIETEMILRREVKNVVDIKVEYEYKPSDVHLFASVINHSADVPVVLQAMGRYAEKIVDAHLTTKVASAVDVVDPNDLVPVVIEAIRTKGLNLSPQQLMYVVHDDVLVANTLFCHTHQVPLTWEHELEVVIPSDEFPQHYEKIRHWLSQNKVVNY